MQLIFLIFIHIIFIHPIGNGLVDDNLIRNMSDADIGSPTLNLNLGQQIRLRMYRDTLNPKVSF